MASIAFDQAEAIVDGNVKRVLARLFGFEQDMRSSAGKRWAWQQAEKLVPRRRPGRFNQAMMELGATVCTPKTPSCRGCPMSSVCEAHHTGRSHQLPYLAPRKAPTTVRLTAVVCGHGERRWLARRAPDGLFGGMWEPPMVQRRGKAARSALVRLLGGGVSSDVSLRAAGRVEHVLSHRKLDVAVLVAQVTKPETIGGLGVDQPDYDELRWCAPEQVALSTLARKVLAVAEVVE